MRTDSLRNICSQCMKSDNLRIVRVENVKTDNRENNLAQITGSRGDNWDRKISNKRNKWA